MLRVVAERSIDRRPLPTESTDRRNAMTLQNRQHTAMTVLLSLASLALALPVCAGDVSTDDAMTRQSPHQDPDKLVDRPGEKALMGYGTDGIADEVDDPGLGIRSNLGRAQDDADTLGSTSFAELDDNDDGRLSRGEAGEVEPAQWRRMDRNGDDHVDRAEFSAFEAQGKPAGESGGKQGMK
jgi:hypothetical protein